MSSIHAQLDGDTEQLIQRLRGMSQINITRAMTAIGEGLRTSTVARFQAAQGPDGRAWEPSIRAAAEGGKTLTKDGILKNSIRSEASAAGAAVGTNDIRAATHQYGDTRTIRAKNKPFLVFKYNGSWRKVRAVTIHIPARPFLGISEEDQQEIRDTLTEMLEG